MHMVVEKNILVTGVNGFIGSNVAKLYIEKGYAVIGVDLASSQLVDGIKYYQLNLMNDDIDTLLLKYKPYAVIHCAGMADVNYSVKHPDNDFHQNVIVPRKVLYSVYNCSPNTKFVFLSSAGVYGNPISLPITEEDKGRPISPYALHKMLMEDICWYFINQFNMDIKILRIFSAYGNGLKKQIFWDMGQKIKNTKKLELFGTGNETRDFIHIRDLVEAIYKITNLSESNEVVYNVANGVEVSIREIAEIFCEAIGYSNDIIEFNGYENIGNPINWCADVGKLKKLGYIQEVSLSDGIKEYVDWLNTNELI